MKHLQPLQLTLFTRLLVLIALVLLIWACTDQAQLAELPTLMVLPSLTPSETATRTPIPTITPSSTATSTITRTPTSTNTRRPSATPTRTLTPTDTITPTPTGDGVVIGEKGVNLRRGPSASFTPAIALLPPGMELFLSGRTSDSRWYEARTAEGQRGWVLADLVELRLDLNTLPITWVNTPTPPLPTIPPPPGTPVTGRVSERTREIFRLGQRLGNKANVFSKVGDSITATQPFMNAFDINRYQLGPFQYLQPTVDFFKGSFNRPSLAAANAFNAAAVLAPMWADPTQCQKDESPLLCEYRIAKPSIAIIMLGSVDVQIYDVNQYRGYMETILDLTLERGIIPVLTTFPNGPSYYVEQSEQFNVVIRELVEKEQIPLIDLRTPAMAMANQGVTDDQFHLTHDESDLINFATDLDRYALTVRDLLSLQMLDTIWRDAMR